MKKILVIRLGAIGDVVFTTIIPYAIKLKHPDYEIHYLVPDEISELLKNNSCIDKVYVWEREKRKSFKYLSSVAKMFRDEKYDVIFNLNNTLRSFLLSIMSFPKKIVQKKTYGGHWAEDAFMCAKSAFPEIENPKRLYLDVTSEKRNEMNAFLSGFPKPYMMIAPGGDTSRNRAGRTWPLESWRELSEKLLKKYGGTVFVCGSEGEKSFHEKLSGENIIVVSGKYDLAGSSAFLSMADVVISGDTGPIHMASAHNVKTLALLGSTSPDKIKPYGENGHWISSDFECKFCWKKKCKYTEQGDVYTPCMTALKPNQVLEEVGKIF